MPVWLLLIEIFRVTLVFDDVKKKEGVRWFLTEFSECFRRYEIISYVIDFKYSVISL